MDCDITELAGLIDERNAIAQRITDVIGRPAQIGHIGEFIASRIFEIQLEESAVAKGIDGVFQVGSLPGKTVNVKFYAKQEGLLDIRLDALPDYFLVLAGPRTMTLTSRGESRLWHIDSVFLFNGHSLAERLKVRGVKIGAATSVVTQQWKDAEIFPDCTNRELEVTKQQRDLLKLFSSVRHDGCST